MCADSRSRLSSQDQPSPSRRRFCSRKLRTVRVGDRLAQGGIGLVAALQGGQVEAAHGVDVAEELASRLVGHRGHVDDDQPLDQLGVAQREHHRDLAAHRVPDQGHRVRPRRTGLGRRGRPGRRSRTPRSTPERPWLGMSISSTRWSAARCLGDLGPVLALPEESVAEGDDRALRPRAGSRSVCVALTGPVCQHRAMTTDPSQRRSGTTRPGRRIEDHGYRPHRGPDSADAGRSTATSSQRELEPPGRRAPPRWRRRHGLLHLRGGRRGRGRLHRVARRRGDAGAAARRRRPAVRGLPDAPSSRRPLRPGTARGRPDGRAAWCCSSGP